MIEELDTLAKQGILIAEYPNGETAPIEKIYEIKGRGGSVNILIDDHIITYLNDEIHQLKCNCETSEEEKETAESELEKAEKSLAEIEQKHEEELDKVENSLESAEQFLGIKTSERLIHYRIGELARKINEKFDSLEEEREHFKRQIEELKVDNQALAWNIEQLETWKENTLKDETPTLN